MTCTRCHQELSEGANYCPVCGEPAVAGGRRIYANRTGERLTRSVTDTRIAGVCGGIAEYLHTDATLVRLVWAILSIIPGCFVGGVVAYVMAWIIIPRADRTAPESVHTSERAA